MREAHTKHAVRFQYKICYSKILRNILCPRRIRDFNTKFVIAKYYVLAFTNVAK